MQRTLLCPVTLVVSLFLAWPAVAAGAEETMENPEYKKLRKELPKSWPL